MLKILKGPMSMWLPFYRTVGEGKTRGTVVIRLKQDADSLMCPFHNMSMWQGQDVVHSLGLKIKLHCLMHIHSCTFELIRSDQTVFR